ncbi:MAG: diguanylate cyclase (GGDEF)-like protein [Glaciecola sp.]
MQDEPAEEALVAQLKDYSERLDLAFYVAHEKSRKQYNSDGRVFDLIEGKVIWYFALKDETDYPVQAVLGKREDVHLYIDVRQYDIEGEFIGFVGVGKSLDDFIASFEKFKDDYGHEFIFVNNRNEIVLSSRQDLLPTSPNSSDEVITIKNISSLPWYSNFAKETQGQIEPSLVVPSANGDLLISQLRIESLNWSIYLLTPLSERQQEVNKSFALYIGLGLLILFVLYKSVISLVDFYADKVSRKLNYDPLTKLSNCRYAYLFFTRQRKQHRTAATIMINVDNFKQVNETHGHSAGNRVLQEVAKLLSKTVRDNDLVVRWGGEKFVLLLLNIEQKEALDLAEKCRGVIQDNQTSIGDALVPTQASVGFAYSRDLADTLALMVEWAEQSVYQAKREGKNLVVARKSA